MVNDIVDYQRDIFVVHSTGIRYLTFVKGGESLSDVLSNYPDYPVLIELQEEIRGYPVVLVHDIMPYTSFLLHGVWRLSEHGGGFLHFDSVPHPQNEMSVFGHYDKKTFHWELRYTSY